MANWRAYRLIKAESNLVGWPVVYRTDITKIDRQTLSRKDAPESFLWILRECGTDLFDLDNPQSPRTHRFNLEWFEATMREHPENKTYLYDLGTLREVSIERCRKALKNAPIARNVA